MQIGKGGISDNLKKTVSDALEARELIKLSTRRYAKRQLTWFRRNPAMNWLVRTPELSADEILMKARRIIQETDK
jgi:tRNA A37 N6-isopentenylltransferase MiaA